MLCREIPSYGNDDLNRDTLIDIARDNGAAHLRDELESDQHFKHRFEDMNLNSLNVEHQAYTPEYLVAFLRWQDPGWKQQSVAVR